VALDRTLALRHARGLHRSLSEHPPFSPMVLRAWVPLGVGSCALIALAAVVDSAELLLTGFVLGAIAGPLAFLVDLQHRTGLAWHPPRAMLLLGALVGGPVAVLVSHALQAGFPPLGPNAPTLLIGPIEEMAKLLVPAALLVVHRASQRGALICAIASAASFQAIENMMVVWGTFGAHDGGVAASAVVLVARGVVGSFTHCMWTSTVAIAWFGTCEVRGVLADPRTRKLVGWLLTVALLHSVWDVATGVEARVPALVLAGLAFGGTLLAHHIATRDAARRWRRARRLGVGRR
jgi:RsiW-degrading membrane proteinase PrsW (M82 family)